MAPASELASATADCPPCGEYFAALRVNPWRPSRQRRDKGGEVRRWSKLACRSRMTSLPVGAAGPDKGRLPFSVISCGSWINLSDQKSTMKFAVCFCVHSGELEIKALLLAASLRKHWPATVELIACVPQDPRFGALSTNAALFADCAECA